ncbi:MAG: ParB/RepB/Spo0J family partition protein [Gammaproteobacteria bacterium]|nr:ParB/RepB/Spo0J family partition protein [Gammaproteobacteria bacterium]
MTKKFGTGNLGAVDGTRKWAAGVKSQISGATHHQSLNVRYLPLNQLTLDPDNPRRLGISLDQVKDLRLLYPLQPEWIAGDSTEEWWDAYAASVAKSLTGKALDDYLVLTTLALSIKHHERLINPVTVFSEDSGTDLKLVAGERRYLAHVILGEELIATRILAARPDALEKDILQWEENNQRVDLSFSEQILNLQRLVQGWEKQRDKALSVSQLVAMAGLPRVTAHRYLSVIRHPDPLLMELIASGRISSLRKAADLSALSHAQLHAWLNPAKSLTPTPPVFVIKRSKDYDPVKKILRAACQQLGGKAYLKMVENQALDTPEAIAAAFDQLVIHISKGMKNDT